MQASNQAEERRRGDLCENGGTGLTMSGVSKALLLPTMSSVLSSVKLLTMKRQSSRLIAPVAPKTVITVILPSALVVTKPHSLLIRACGGSSS